MSRRMDAFDREPASRITGTALSTVSDSVTVALTFRFTRHHPFLLFHLRQDPNRSPGHK